MAAINPTVLSTPSPQGLPLQQILAADSVTWKKGEILYLSSGTVTPVSSATGGATNPHYIAAEDQNTATSTSTVWVRKIEPGTRLKMYLTNNGTNALESAFTKGTKYAAYTASNVAYADVNVTSNADFEYERGGSDVEPNKAPTAAPQWAVFVYNP